MNEKIVVVAGSRKLTEIMTDDEARQLVWGVLNGSPFQIGELVSGGARGVDSLAEEYAENNNIDLTVMEADWDTFGSFAGPRRNSEMADYAEAGVIIRVDESAGSTDMLKKARKHFGEENIFLVDIDSTDTEN